MASSQGNRARKRNGRNWIGKEEANGFIHQQHGHPCKHNCRIENTVEEQICGFSKFSDYAVKSIRKNACISLAWLVLPTWLFITKLKFLEQHWVKEIKHSGAKVQKLTQSFVVNYFFTKVQKIEWERTSSSKNWAGMIGYIFF